MPKENRGSNASIRDSLNVLKQWFCKDIARAQVTPNICIRPNKALALFFGIIILTGIFFRFYHITQNQFVYYDEGMWLNQNRSFVTLVDHNPPKSFSELLKILNIMTHLSLATAKSLWAFLSMLRGLIVGAWGWYFTRVISAVFGSLTLGITYVFARRYYDSRWTGLLSAALLAIFPSHIYYSRLALQESLTTFFFLLGLYYFLYPRKLHWKTFLSAGFLSLVFFANYRMIITPVLIGFCALWECFSRKEKFNIQKYIWHTVTFVAIIFLVGNIDKGANTNITFAWMFHQANLAQGHFDWINFFSYPYYLFRLESVFFGVFFFGNIYFIVRRQWAKLFPFAIVCLMMGLFSLSQEKGVRYLCAVMPFMVMAAAGLIVALMEDKKSPSVPFFQRGKIFQRSLIVAVALMMGAHLVKGNAIAHFLTDYESSMQALVESNPRVKVLSTQHMVQKLYVDNEKDVAAAPRKLNHLAMYYMQGYRYLMMDPQVYVSYTADNNRFTPELKGYLEFVSQNVVPVKTYSHFSPALLERFVLEHNENLPQSLAFLHANKDGDLGQLKVYDIKECLAAIRNRSGK